MKRHLWTCFIFQGFILFVCLGVTIPGGAQSCSQLFLLIEFSSSSVQGAMQCRELNRDLHAKLYISAWSISLAPNDIWRIEQNLPQPVPASMARCLYLLQKNASLLWGSVSTPCTVLCWGANQGQTAYKTVYCTSAPKGDFVQFL